MSTDIALSSAMRSNLQALQNTSSLQDMMQSQMATGKKVNSAIDNPTSYFTAQSLNNRATDLSNRMDAVGQALQTLKATSTSITAITTLVGQAKALAQTALDAAGGNVSNLKTQQANATHSASIAAYSTPGTVATGATKLEVGWAALGAVPNGTMTIKVNDNAVTIDLGHDMAVGDAGGPAMSITDITGLVNDINTKLGTNSTTSAYLQADGSIGFRGPEGTKVRVMDGANAAGSVGNATAIFGVNNVSITRPDGTYSTDNAFTLGAASSTDKVADAFGPNAVGTFTIQTKTTGPTGAQNDGNMSTVTVGATTTIAQLVTTLNQADSNLHASWNATSQKIEFASTSGLSVAVGETGAATTVGTTLFGVNVANAQADITAYNTAVAGQISNNTPITAAVNSAVKFTTFGSSNSTATVLKAQVDFKTVMAQIDKAVNDASYKGKNLMKASDTMNVIFNEDGSSNLTVEGGNFTYAGDLNFSDVTKVDWTKSGAIQQSIDQANNATQTLRDTAAKFGTSQSIIQTRSDFATSMISTLKSGADSLTLADMNELAANSLALQTQRQLATNSLTMASQAAQSVLQMFR